MVVRVRAPLLFAASGEIWASPCPASGVAPQSNEPWQEPADTRCIGSVLMPVGLEKSTHVRDYETTSPEDVNRLAKDCLAPDKAIAVLIAPQEPARTARQAGGETR